MIRSILIYVFALITSVCVGQQSLQAKLFAALGHTDFKHANATIAVLDLSSGKMIAGVNENKMLIPASSLKLVTSLSALDILGEDFTFNTQIGYTKELDKNGVVSGNLVIVGDGDPTLGSAKFDETLDTEELLDRIVSEIRRLGITCIDGDVVVDESVFNSFPISPSWQWNDLGNYYAAGAWGLNINENQYKVVFGDRTKIGRKPRIKYTTPKIYGLNIDNEVLVDSAGTGDNAYIFGGPYNYNKRIVGTIPAGNTNFTIKGSIPDPPMFFAQSVLDHLERKGIKAGKATTFYDKSSKKKITPILSIKSPLLKDIVRRANQESSNLYCEALIKKLGAELGTEGQATIGMYVLNRYLRKLGVRSNGLYMEDGSGLSARNNASSLFLARFLQKYAKKNGLDKTIQLLAVGGSSGTLARMFRGSEAKGRVYAKSGYMSRVLSYTGYIKNKRNKWVSFSIIVNGFDAKPKVIRKRLEKMMTDIYKYS